VRERLAHCWCHTLPLPNGRGSEYLVPFNHWEGIVVMQRTISTKRLITRVTATLAVVAVFTVVGSAALRADPPEIKTQETPQTLLLVKTTPAGAEIRLDGKSVGLSGELLPVRPGTYKLVVDMAGHEPIEQNITVRNGRITRIELTLKTRPSGEASQSIQAKELVFTGGFCVDSKTGTAVILTAAQAGKRMTLKRDDNKPDGKRSFGGSGEMIRYSLPKGNWKVRGVQIHGSRYGMPQAPSENFQVYFLDKDLSGVIATEEAPYRQFQRGRERWVRVHFKRPVEVPKEFWVCVNFNAHQTKGVYLSYDTSTGGKYSKVGLPEGEKTDVDFGGDWMIRVDLIAADKDATASTPDEAPPRIVATSPRVGATEVDPSITEITVTFDRDMASGFSWTGGGPDFPPATEGQPPHWRSRRTCVFPVTLEAEAYYRIGINSDSFKNFKSVAGVPAEPSEIYFTTVGADEETLARVGKPRIVAMDPPNGATDVDPGLREIRVTFDRPMGPDYSWVGGGPHFPEVPKGQKPRWVDGGKTCVLYVRLKPGWHYELGLNSPSFKNFKSAAGVALEPVVYEFSTRKE